MKHDREIFFLKAMITLTVLLLIGVGQPMSAMAAADHDGLQDAEAVICFECHDELGSPPAGEIIHPPFGDGECLACHELAADKTFKTLESGSALCAMCHDEKGTMAIVHGPVAEGECLSCHKPHHSPNTSLLTESNLEELCFSCHDREMVETKFIHGPVAVNECLSCHNPHESEWSSLLLKDGAALCLMCHEEMSKKLGKKPHTHSAIEDSGCTGCHSPHGSEYQYQLLQSVPALCTECHSEKGEEVLSPHGAMSEKDSCLNCHEPHAADLGQLLKEEGTDLCMRCHNRRLRTEEGLIENMENFLKRNEVHHGALEEAGCQACHNPHGSDRYRILVREFPKTFYAPFDVERYSLCFECHDDGLVLDKMSTDTEFRHGERNLHYVHVNHPKKGRRCMVCHDPHATSDPKLVKKFVKFGRWKLPINLELQDDGGTCTPACHVPQTYRRLIETLVAE